MSMLMNTILNFFNIHNHQIHNHPIPINTNNDIVNDINNDEKIKDQIIIITSLYCHGCDNVMFANIKHCTQCDQCHYTNQYLYCKCCNSCYNPYSDDDIIKHRKICNIYRK